MNLYEIENEILKCVDEETGEIFDVEKFEALELARDVKIENICLWIKNLKAEAEALKLEISDPMKHLQVRLLPYARLVTDEIYCIGFTCSVCFCRCPEYCVFADSIK